MYGSDSLNKFLLFLFVVQLVIFRWIYPVTYADSIGIALIVIVYYRMLSKNISARYSENRKFLEITANIRKPLKRIGNNISDKEYKYIECTSCKQELRVPKKKGKIKVTCKKCGNKFEVRT